MHDFPPLPRLCSATRVLGLALLVGVGCSGGESSTTSQVNDPEIAEIIKSTKNPKEKQALIRQALLRRSDPALAAAPPKSKPGKRKSPANR